MILRKPYAFLIKNFKLIHIILSVLMIYTLYQTNQIRIFFSNYISSLQSVVGTSLTDTYFNSLMYLFPFLVIVLSIIIINLMKVKSKPIFYYIFTIIVSIIIVVMYSITHGVLMDMQAHVVDIRTIKLVRDFIFMLLIVQSINTVLTVVRATGFDIKKFNFTEDLAELEITDVDNEEFEFEVNVDMDKIQRKVNRRKRYLGYIYKENKLTIQIISGIAGIILFFIVLLNVTIYNKKYTQNVAFSTDEFIITVNNAYVTNKDNKGNVLLNDKKLVVLDMTVRTLGNKEKTFNLSKLELVIGKNKYYHTYVYRDKLLDLGNAYYNETINKNNSRYLIIYEIPDGLSNKKMTFKYLNSFSYKIGKVSAKTIDVKLDLRNLDKVKKEIDYKTGDTIDFKESILKNSNLLINNSEISDSFRLKYKICTDECYEMIEYAKPSIYNTYDKTLIKLNSTFNIGDKASPNIGDLFKLISMYGEINYTISGVNKVDKTITKQVTLNKVKEDNIYYIETLKEVENADSVILKLKIRDMVYNYIVK